MGKFLRVSNLLALILVCFVVISPPALAANLSQSCAVETVENLAQRGVLSPETAQQQQNYILSHPDQFPVSLGQKARGLLTVSNIVWVVASFLIVIAIAWLGVLYLVPLLALIPIEAYEVLGYGTCIGFLVASPNEFWVLPGALGLGGMWTGSHFLHHSVFQKFYHWLKTDPIRFGSGLFCLLWGGIAIAYQSQVLGFLTILALEAFVGFVVAVIPGAYGFGFSRGFLPTATFTSLGLILIYTAHSQGWLVVPHFDVFQTGVFFIGTFVYSLGVLIWSSKWYPHQSQAAYPLLQVGAIASGVAALYWGSLLGLHTIQGIGGTFFFLYVLEKYFELPWREELWAWATLGLASLLWGSAWVMQHYPDYFLWGS